jgi:hypothetical protein
MKQLQVIIKRFVMKVAEIQQYMILAAILHPGELSIRFFVGYKLDI